MAALLAVAAGCGADSGEASGQATRSESSLADDVAWEPFCETVGAAAQTLADRAAGIESSLEEMDDQIEALYGLIEVLSVTPTELRSHVQTLQSIPRTTVVIEEQERRSTAESALAIATQQRCGVDFSWAGYTGT